MNEPKTYKVTLYVDSHSNDISLIRRDLIEAIARKGFMPRGVQAVKDS